jgi:hypothetical protein
MRKTKRIEKMTTANIMYKTLGFKWLPEVFCPASAFVTADRDEARNPQRFIHVSVVLNLRQIKSPFNSEANELRNCINLVEATNNLN